MRNRRTDHLAHWSLLEKPFGRDGARRFFAATPQREAIARLHFLVAGEVGSAILLGERGCGMTTLLRYVAWSRGFGDHAVEILLTRGDHSQPRQVLADLATAMRIRFPASDLADQVASAIDATSRQGVETLWLIDHCETAAGKVARTLLDTHARFSVVLGASPERGQHLSASLGHCPLRIELPPWSLADTFAYVSHSIRSAGGRRPIFSDSAVVRIHEIAEGRISPISSLAELALLVGAAHGVDEIRPEMIELVDEELVRAA